MTHGWIVVAFVVTLGGLSCASPPSPDATPRAVVEAIDAGWDAHLRAAVSKDAAHIADIYAPDAVYVLPDGRELRGWAAIDAFERAGLTGASVSDVRHTTRAVHAAGDTAYELGTIEGRVQSGTQPAAIMTYHFMAMWARQPDGEWRMRYLVGRP